jgi:hypothetical protein
MSFNKAQTAHVLFQPMSGTRLLCRHRLLRDTTGIYLANRPMHHEICAQLVCLALWWCGAAESSTQTFTPTAPTHSAFISPVRTVSDAVRCKDLAVGFIERLGYHRCPPQNIVLPQPARLRHGHRHQN